MGFQPTFIQCQLLLFGGVVALVALCTVSFTPDLEEQPFSPGECEGCHNSFVPLEMEVAVERVNPDWPAYTIEVEVHNPDEHEVRDLWVILLNDIGKNGSGQDSRNGVAPVGSSASETLEVDTDVIRLDIWLDGDDGAGGINDLDMEVTGPSGGQWSSAGAGPDEEVHLQAHELAAEGPGTFTVDINWFSGLGPIGYDLLFEWEYAQAPLEKEGRKLLEGRSQTFTWHLNMTPEQADNISLDVKLLAFYDHEGTGPDEQAYTLSYREGALVTNEPQDFGRLGLGQALGITLLVLVVVSTVTGLYAASRLPLPEWLADAPRKLRYRGHTLASLLLVVLVIPHALVLQTGIYSGTPTGIQSGLPTLAVLAILSVITLDIKRLSKRWGFKKVQWVHRGTVLLFLLLLANHLLKIATHL